MDYKDSSLLFIRALWAAWADPFLAFPGALRWVLPWVDRKGWNSFIHAFGIWCWPLAEGSCSPPHDLLSSRIECFPWVVVSRRNRKTSKAYPQKWPGIISFAFYWSKPVTVLISRVSKKMNSTSWDERQSYSVKGWAYRNEKNCGHMFQFAAFIALHNFWFLNQIVFLLNSPKPILKLTDCYRFMKQWMFCVNLFPK